MTKLQEEFDKLKEENGFLEYAEVHGNGYGTSIKAMEAVQSQGQMPIFDIDCQATANVKTKKFNMLALTLFRGAHLPKSLKTDPHPTAGRREGQACRKRTCRHPPALPLHLTT